VFPSNSVCITEKVIRMATITATDANCNLLSIHKKLRIINSVEYQLHGLYPMSGV